MVICILTTDDKLGIVRERAKQIEKFVNHTVLAIPLSTSSNLPVTHWFCTFNASEEMLEQIKSLQEFTEVVESNPRTFLESKNLKIISQKKIMAAKKEV